MRGGRGEGDDRSEITVEVLEGNYCMHSHIMGPTVHTCIANYILHSMLWVVEMCVCANETHVGCYILRRGYQQPPINN